MIESLEAYKQELKGLKIRRTREIRWYDDKGRRWADLWSHGGRALFGYRPAEIKKTWESALSKGLNIPYSGIYAKRLEKIPSLLGFPEYKCAFFPSKSDMTAWFAENKVEFKDIFHFRPYSSEIQTNSDIIQIVLPNPFTNCELVLFKNALPMPEFPCPASEAVLIVKICHEIIAFHSFFENISIPQALAQKFSISGPYLVFKGTEEAYIRLISKAFEQGFILPPEMNDPTIFSPFLSENEKIRLTKVLED